VGVRRYRDAVSEAPANFGDYQTDIYLNGMFAGELPSITTDLAWRCPATPATASSPGSR